MVSGTLLKEHELIPATSPKLEKCIRGQSLNCELNCSNFACSFGSSRILAFSDLTA